MVSIQLMAAVLCAGGWFVLGVLLLGLDPGASAGGAVISYLCVFATFAWLSVKEANQEGGADEAARVAPRIETRVDPKTEQLVRFMLAVLELSQRSQIKPVLNQLIDEHRRLKSGEELLNLQAVIEKRDSELVELRGELSQMRRQLTQERTSGKRKPQKRTTAENELQKVQAECEALREKLKSVEQSKDSATASRGWALSQLEQAQISESNLRAQVRQNEEELNRSEVREANLRTEVATAYTELTAARQQLLGYQQKIEELSEQLATTEQAVERLQTLNSAIQQIAETGVTELQQELNHAQAEQGRLGLLLQERESALSSVEAKLATQQELLRQKSATFAAARKSWQSEKERFSAALRKSAEALAVAQQHSETVTGEAVEKLRTEVEELQLRSTALSRRLTYAFDFLSASLNGDQIEKVQEIFGAEQWEHLLTLLEPE